MPCQPRSWRRAYVISVVTQLALSGDAACCRLILERTVPAFRPADSGVVLPMPSNGTLTERALAMVDAMSAGLVSPAAAAATINALAAMVKVTEIDDLERRLRSLEEDQGKEPSRG